MKPTKVSLVDLASSLLILMLSFIIHTGQLNSWKCDTLGRCPCYAKTKVCNVGRAQVVILQHDSCNLLSEGFVIVLSESWDAQVRSSEELASRLGSSSLRVYSRLEATIYSTEREASRRPHVAKG